MILLETLKNLIHSNLKQEERIRNYDLFKANGSRLLVATDLFGRGIDI